jgi:hypothetical protein
MVASLNVVMHSNSFRKEQFFKNKKKECTWNWTSRWFFDCNTFLVENIL